MVDSDRPQILIVEDEPAIADIERVALEHLEVDITHFNIPANALVYLQDHKPDLLVLDIGLPGMSGWEFLERVKADNLLYDDTPVIVTTAFNDPANRVVGKLQSVHRYVTKPFSPIDFRKIVADVLGLG
jgi:CheY-like chemotaxis protein